jgi:hypothetical protein
MADGPPYDQVWPSVKVFPGVYASVTGHCDMRAFQFDWPAC